jgi:hypothetical protein
VLFHAVEAEKLVKKLRKRKVHNLNKQEKEKEIL